LGVTADITPLKASVLPFIDVAGFSCHAKIPLVYKIFDHVEDYIFVTVKAGVAKTVEFIGFCRHINVFWLTKS
jgi:hypothetical protein